MKCRNGQVKYGVSNRNNYRRDIALDLGNEPIVIMNKRYYWQKKSNQCYIYRYDPVPGIGKCLNGGYYRSIKTTQELRTNRGLIDDKMGQYVRGKRRGNDTLPNSWDDIRRSDMQIKKSWKKNKKRKQWMK